MDLLSFFAGLITGAVCVAISAFIINKNTKASKDLMLEQMKISFENTANKILKENTGELTNHNKEKLEEFFTRFKDQIEIFEKRAEANLKTETEHFTIFDANIKSFLATGNKISNDANALVNVMKADNRTQGKWGELLLERVLASSGLRKGEEYETQKVSEEGRPDATIFLPDNRCIYIDSKTSISSWDGVINAKDEAEKEKHLKAFIESTKKHITGLAKRKYYTDEKSPGYVLMFIPIESCYSVLFCDNCELWDFAWKNNVMPVSPTTLLAALKIINSFHIIDRQNKNASEISELCSAMLDKFSTMLSDLLKIRSNLENSIKKLNGKGNILNQIKEIEKLGVKLSKPIPELPEDLQSESVSDED